MTNFTARSPAGMLRPELGSRENGTILLLLLTTGFAQLPIKRSRSRLRKFPDLNRQLVTAFRSPTSTPRYRATVIGSKFLACHFAVTPICPTDPFGLKLLPSPFRTGALDAQNPLSTTQTDAFNSTIGFSLLFRAVKPFRIIALIHCQTKGSPWRFARLSFAPR